MNQSPIDAETSTRFFDAHLHIIDPRFPLEANQGYRPAPFTVAEYRTATTGLNVIGGAVVCASFQRGHNHLRAALAELGPNFVGVTDLHRDATDAELQSLDAAGVRGMRVNLYRGGREALDQLERLAHRVWDLVGWHIELYLDARELPDLEPRLVRLPRLAIDHLGMTEPGRDTLLRLVDRGVHVKASGFGRVRLDIPATLRAIHAANPHALIAGTDLPSTRANRPFSPQDLALIADTLGPHAAQLVLHDNARAFYRSDTIGPR